MRRRDLLGPWGEALACEYLRGRGCRIVACNYRSRFGEIDVIAEDRKFLIFAEVKLRKTALLWLEGHETRLQPRFDVIEIYAPDGMATKQPVIRQLEDAF